MRRPIGAARARRTAQYQGHARLLAVHVAKLRSVVHELIHGEGDEVHEHHFDHGSGTEDGRANRQSHDRRLGDRRVAHPVWAEFF